MKKIITVLTLLLCLMPVNARGMAFPIEAMMNSSARSYDYEIKGDMIVYNIDIGARDQQNTARIPIETVEALRASGVTQIEYSLPWISGKLNLDTLTIPQYNEALRVTVTGVEPAGAMRSAWRAVRPAKLIDPFALEIGAEFTHITLAPGIVGNPRPDPEPVSGAALGFIVKIRYPYARDRIRVLRWNGSGFVDIPSANWDIFTEDGATYVEGFYLEPGIYTVIDGNAL